MDILVYSNIKEAYPNIETTIARRVLRKPNVTKYEVKWITTFNIHLGKALSLSLDLDYPILSQCATYEDIMGNSNAMKECAKVKVLVDAFGVHSQLETLDILQNYPSVALGYLQDQEFLKKVCSSRETLKELVKNESYCNVVYQTISNHRETILSTLGAGTTVNLGNGYGTYYHANSLPYIHIPISCYDDSDTDFSVYSYNSNQATVSIPRHSGTETINSGVCLRGAKVVGSGGSVGYVTFTYYNLA